MNNRNKISRLNLLLIGGITAGLIIFGGVTETKAADSVAVPINNAEQNSVFIFSGSIMELENTTMPTDLLVRDLSSTTTIDYIVELDANTVIARSGDWSSDLAFWLVGDVVKVLGYKVNEETVHANAIINTSIVGLNSWTQNGFIKDTNCDQNQITVTWGNQDWRVDLVSNATKIVIPPNVNKTCEDLNNGDRVRIRGFKHPTLNIIQAKIVFVLRSGFINYVKRTTERLQGTLIQIASDTAPTTAVVRTRGENPTSYIVHITENTKIRQRFFGPGSIDEWIAGDDVTFLVKEEAGGSELATRIAVMAKNNSIWKVSTHGMSGEIMSIDYANNQFVLKWGPNDRLFRVDFNDNTHIVKDTINPAAFTDLKVGDTVRGRGEKHAGLPIIVADICVAWTPQD